MWLHGWIAGFPDESVPLFVIQCVAVLLCCHCCVISISGKVLRWGHWRLRDIFRHGSCHSSPTCEKLRGGFCWHRNGAMLRYHVLCWFLAPQMAIDVGELLKSGWCTGANCWIGVLSSQGMYPHRPTGPSSWTGIFCTNLTLSCH